LATLAALAILLALGTWQLKRKAWKDGLTAQIAARVTAEPSTLMMALARATSGEDIEYLRVRLAGIWRHDREIHLHALDGGTAGWHVITPLEMDGGTLVLVNRGFVPQALKNRDTRAGGLVAGQVEFNGLVRRFPTAKGAFTPANAIDRNEWYWLDVSALRTAAGATSAATRVAPFLVDMERVTVAVPPAGGATRLTLPNRHLEYALTWYGLAATLIGVFAAFSWSRWQRGP
jgi:surfeit locus 1 family protein